MRTIVPACLLFFLACGGGSNPTPPPQPPGDATPKLGYTDPTSGDYRLMKNASLSTATRLVLDLVGPASAQGRGLAFTLGLDGAKAIWVAPGNGGADLVEPLTFDLGATPRIFKVRSSGGTLEAAYSQKGAAVSAKALGGPLARVALEAKPGATGNLGLTTGKAQVLLDTSAPVNIPVAAGTATLQ